MKPSLLLLREMREKVRPHGKAPKRAKTSSEHGMEKCYEFFTTPLKNFDDRYSSTI